MNAKYRKNYESFKSKYMKLKRMHKGLRESCNLSVLSD